MGTNKKFTDHNEVAKEIHNASNYTKSNYIGLINNNHIRVCGDRNNTTLHDKSAINDSHIMQKTAQPLSQSIDHRMTRGVMVGFKSEKHPSTQNLPGNSPAARKKNIAIQSYKDMTTLENQNDNTSKCSIDDEPNPQNQSDVLETNQYNAFTRDYMNNKLGSGVKALVKTDQSWRNKVKTTPNLNKHISDFDSNEKYTPPSFMNPFEIRTNDKLVSDLNQKDNDVTHPRPQINKSALNETGNIQNLQKEISKYSRAQGGGQVFMNTTTGYNTGVMHQQKNNFEISRNKKVNTVSFINNPGETRSAKGKQAKPRENVEK